MPKSHVNSDLKINSIFVYERVQSLGSRNNDLFHSILILNIRVICIELNRTQEDSIQEDIDTSANTFSLTATVSVNEARDHFNCHYD